MAERNKIVAILNVLPFSRISEDWVKNVWESDFTEIGDLDEDVFIDIDSLTLQGHLDDLSRCLNHWISQQSEEDGLWTALVEEEVSLKTVQALLAYFILKGHKKSCDLSEKEVAISAASVYMKLVQVPGSSAFKVFHPELYEKSMDFVKQFISLGSSSSKKRKRSNITPVKSSQGRRNNKNKRKQRTSDSQDGSGFGADEDDDSEGGEQELAPQEVNKLRKHLHFLLVELVEFLETFSLRQSASSGYHSVQVLAPLTRHEPDMFDGNLESGVPKSRQSVPALAYKGLQALCAQLHGHVGSLMNATFKHLLPNVLMLIGDKSVQNISKQMQTTRDIAIDFICLLMRQCGERGTASVRTLLQHMCTRVTDRAEYRSKVAQAVVKITKELPIESYCSMVQWFHKLSRHSQINNRGFALEIVAALLGTPERQPTENVPAELQPYITHIALIGILLDKCSDKAPTVRARAITCFSQCLVSGDERIAGTVKEVMTPQVTGRPQHVQRLIRTPNTTVLVAGDRQTLGESTEMGSEVTIAQQTVEGSTVAGEGPGGGAKEGEIPLNRVHLTPGFDPNLSDSEGVFSMLRRRAKDQKVNVRKAALQAIESAVRFEMPAYTKQNVEVLQEHCRDPGLSVRKQSMQSLTDLLMDCPHDTFIQTCWLKGVLPLVIDRETTLSEKCMEALEELILHNIVLVVRSKCESHILAWNLLGIISKPQSVDQRRYLQKACHHWSRQGKIKPALISALESHIGSENNAAAWMLLAEIAPAAPKINHVFLLNYWNNHGNDDFSSETMQRVLTVMKCVAKHLPSEDRNKLITDLKRRLLQFNSPSDLISVTVSTVSKLCSVQSSETGDVTIATDWSADLLSACDKFLSKVVLERDGISTNDDLIVCYLFTLGEVVQLCPGKVPKRVFLIVQSMIATPCITSLPASQPASHSQAQPANNNSQSEHGTSSQSSSHSGHGDALSSSQTSQGSSDSQSTQSTQPLTQFRGSHMSSRIRAFAFITLGKLCLQNEGLAKKCIAALARELEISTEPAIRNNVMIVMCDLCVRYTTTANHYIPNIASCLKDPSPLVRKQTLTLITRLLQEDFLKWKGSLFYRFISALLDTCEEIQKFGEFCLIHMLIQRHPKMFFQHFMECVFHFNDYREHSVYNKFVQSDKDRELFSLKGENNVKQRHSLYRFLLENMSDDHKFQIQGKLVQEVLGGIVDNILPSNEDTSHILKDALHILSSKEIKLSSLKIRPNEEVANDEQEMAAVVVATTKKTIITQVVKKNVIENIVPVVVSLKHMMEKQRSPLLKQLLTYLRELMKDYKTEITEILSTDRQLATEIEFDLRKFEEEQAAMVRLNAAPSVQGTPQAIGPNRSPVPGLRLQSPTVQDRAAKSPVPNTHESPTTNPSTPGRSPRAPALKGAVGSPRPGTSKTPAPILRLVSSRTTPAREAPLSTLAVLNSARRVAVVTSQSPSAASRTRTQSASDSETATTSSSRTTPTKKNILGRAISTPSVAMSNITFHGDGNMTLMPPSPIQETSISNELHLYDDETSAIMDSEHKENTPGRENVLLIKSPLAGAPKPRVWNVTSPQPNKTKQRVIQDTDNDDSPVPLANIQNGATNGIQNEPSKDQSKRRTQNRKPVEENQTSVKPARRKSTRRR